MDAQKLAQRKRRERDIQKLVASRFRVERNPQNDSQLLVSLEGPKDTLYEGGFWKIHLHLPEQYPFKSPSLGFANKIFHPNVDFESGSICLDVINQTWTPMYELVHIFQIFLPQLLAYPNPADPLNHEAANLLNSDPKRYAQIVKDLVARMAPDPSAEPRPERKESPPKRMHKASTDVEDFSDMSDQDELSDLSDNPDILHEQDVL